MLGSSHWPGNWKDSVDRLVWLAGRSSFSIRRLLAPIGLRTRAAAYRGRVALVQLYGSTRVWLTHLDENYLSFQLFWKSWTHYEPLTTALMMELLRDKQVFLDVGANVGYFSLSAAALFPGLQVVAFEPNPKMSSILRRNIAHNGFRILSEDVALSDQSTTQRFYLPPSDMSGSLLSSFNESVERTIDVQTMTLDEYLDERPPTGDMLIKIDTEGHEPAVLRGAARTLERHRPDLIVEVTQDFDDASNRLLSELGYRFYHITDEGLIPDERLTVCARGDFLFLNALVSCREPAEVARLFWRMKARVSAIDLRQTSLYRPPP